MTSRGGMHSILFSAYVWSLEVRIGLVDFLASGGYVFVSLLCICKRALKGGGGKRVKGERSQCIVTLVPMVFLAVRSAIVSGYYRSGVSKIVCGCAMSGWDRHVQCYGCYIGQQGTKRVIISVTAYKRLHHVYYSMWCVYNDC